MQPNTYMIGWVKVSFLLAIIGVTRCEILRHNFCAFFLRRHYSSSKFNVNRNRSGSDRLVCNETSSYCGWFLGRERLGLLNKRTI